MKKTPILFVCAAMMLTGNYFLDLNKTFQENQIAYGDILIYGR